MWLKLKWGTEIQDNCATKNYNILLAQKDTETSWFLDLSATDTGFKTELSTMKTNTLLSIKIRPNFLEKNKNYWYVQTAALRSRISENRKTERILEETCPQSLSNMWKCQGAAQKQTKQLKEDTNINIQQAIIRKARTLIRTGLLVEIPWNFLIGALIVVLLVRNC